MTTNSSADALATKESLRATMLFIEYNLPLWSQSEWGHDDETCGTRHCFAGWGLALAGATFRTAPRLGGGKTTSYFEVEVDSLPSHVAAALNGTDLREYPGDPKLYAETPEAAQVLFGLTTDEARELFLGGNNLGDLRRLVQQYSLGPDESFTLPAHTVEIVDGDLMIAKCELDGHDEEACGLIGLLDRRPVRTPGDGMHTLTVDVYRFGETFSWDEQEVRHGQQGQ